MAVEPFAPPVIPATRGDSRRAVAGYLTLYAAIGAWAPFIAVYYDSRGLDLETIGLLAAVFAAASMVGAPLWGLAADLRGTRYPVMAIAALIAAVCAAGVALASGATALAIAAAALALAMAGIAPLLDTRALEVVGEGRARYGRFRVWGSVSFIAAVVVTGWIVDRAGIGSIFPILIVALIGTAVVGAGLRSRGGTPPVPRQGAVRAVLGSRQLMAFLAVALITWASATAVNAFYSIHLTDIGAAPSLVGVAWALGAAVEVPIMLAFPFLARRVGVGPLLVAGAGLFVLRAAVLALTQDPLLVTLTMLIHGGAFALTLVGGVLYVAQHAPAGAAATAQGSFSAVSFGLAQVVGPGIGGALGHAFGLLTMFQLAGIGSAAAVVALALLAGRRDGAG